jgi:hypothetical protein
MRICDGSNKGTASVHKIVCGDATFLSRFITGDESWIYSYDPEAMQQSSQWKKSKLTETKKGETGEEQSQEHAHHFHCSQRSHPAAKQSILYITVMYYSIQRMTEALGIVHMHGRRLL